MYKSVKLLSIIVLLGMAVSVVAQEAASKEENQPVYQFTETVNVPHTPVDNQGSSGTCWCFAGIGFVEAEILPSCEISDDCQEIYGSEGEISGFALTDSYFWYYVA